MSRKPEGPVVPEEQRDDLGPLAGHYTRESIGEKLSDAIETQAFRIINHRMDLKMIENEFGANRQLVVQMRRYPDAWWTHPTKVSWFRLVNGRMEKLMPDARGNPPKADFGIDMTRDALIAIALGRRKYTHPGTGEAMVQAYYPLDALTHNEMRIWGLQASNTVLLFSKIQRAFPQVQKELAEHFRGA